MDDSTKREVERIWQAVFIQKIRLEGYLATAEEAKQFILKTSYDLSQAAFALRALLDRKGSRKSKLPKKAKAKRTRSSQKRARKVFAGR